MKTKTALKTKKPLRSKTKLRSGGGKKKRNKPDSIPALRKKADTLFSRYVRLRDSEFIDGEWVGECITCDRKLVVINSEGKWQQNAQWGHFIGRGNHWLRYNEENGNLQCAHCNAWRDKESMLEAYRSAIDDKYGVGVCKRLKKEAKDNEKFNLKKSDYRQVIADCKTQIDYYLT